MPFLFFYKGKEKRDLKGIDQSYR